MLVLILRGFSDWLKRSGIHINWRKGKSLAKYRSGVGQVNTDLSVLEGTWGEIELQLVFEVRIGFEWWNKGWGGGSFVMRGPTSMEKGQHWKCLCKITSGCITQNVELPALKSSVPWWKRTFPTSWRHPPGSSFPTFPLMNSFTVPRGLSIFSKTIPDPLPLIPPSPSIYFSPFSTSLT